MFTYINGRFVRDKVIQHAIMQAFRPILEKGRYPCWHCLSNWHRMRWMSTSIPPNAGSVSDAKTRCMTPLPGYWKRCCVNPLAAAPAPGPVTPPQQPATVEAKSNTPYQAGVQQALDRFMAAPPSPLCHGSTNLLPRTSHRRSSQRQRQQPAVIFQPEHHRSVQGSLYSLSGR